MPAPSGRLVELEQQLAGLLVQFEILSEAWPMAPQAVDREPADRDMICGEHYGQRPWHCAASTGRTHGGTDQQPFTVQKSPC